MSRDFVQLHAHSHMSMLDALPSPEELAERAAELGMRACALTDHGNLYGTPRFRAACIKAGIAPALGCEFYVVPDMDAKTRDSERGARRHLTVLARDAVGWRSLVRLSTESFRRGHFYKPRIDERTLLEHSGGLLVLSGCQSGELARAAVSGGVEAAERVAARYREALGDRYHLELIALDRTSERWAAALAVQSIHERLGIPVVVTNDVHYLRPEDSVVHSYLTRVGPGEKRGYRCDELWMKDGDQVFDTFVRHWSGSGLRKALVEGGIERAAALGDSIEAYEIAGGQDISGIEVATC